MYVVLNLVDRMFTVLMSRKNLPYTIIYSTLSTFKHVESKWLAPARNSCRSVLCHCSWSGCRCQIQRRTPELWKLGWDPSWMSVKELLWECILREVPSRRCPTWRLRLWHPAVPQSQTRSGGLFSLPLNDAGKGPFSWSYPHPQSPWWHPNACLPNRPHAARHLCCKLFSLSWCIYAIPLTVAHGHTSTADHSWAPCSTEPRSRSSGFCAGDVLPAFAHSHQINTDLLCLMPASPIANVSEIHSPISWWEVLSESSKLNLLHYLLAPSCRCLSTSPATSWLPWRSALFSHCCMFEDRGLCPQPNAPTPHWLQIPLQWACAVSVRFWIEGPSQGHVSTSQVAVSSLCAPLPWEAPKGSCHDAALHKSLITVESVRTVQARFSLNIFYICCTGRRADANMAMFDFNGI